MTGPSWLSQWDNLLRLVPLHPSRSHGHFTFSGRGRPGPGRPHQPDSLAVLLSQLSTSANTCSSSPAQLDALVK